MPVTLVVVLVAVWVNLRVAELLLSDSNAVALLEQGAQERCTGQHRWLLVANTVPPATSVTGLWLAPAVLTPGPSSWSWLFLTLLVAAEGVHWWAIATLGRRWTTRVYVVPGEVAVRRGPYRYLRHPGYAAGGTSAVLLPAVAGCWWGAALVAVVMAAFIVRRVRCEDAAWQALAGAAQH